MHKTHSNPTSDDDSKIALNEEGREDIVDAYMKEISSKDNEDNIYTKLKARLAKRRRQILRLLTLIQHI